MSAISSQLSSQPREIALLGSIPPLQTGDHLTRDEFERRYRAMPRNTKAELLEGIVYIMTPSVSADGHGVPHFEFITWLGAYRWSTPGTQGGDNTSVRLDSKNEPQPDVYLRILPSHGGQSRTSEDKFIEGAPELVTEIAASSVSYDLHEKLEVYRRNGVQEYIVWRTWERAIDWFKLVDGKFVRQVPGDDGILKSTVFPGLWLAVNAMLAGDQAKVEAALRQGLASPEHLQFVQKLQAQSVGANA
jgi:Uma2 family endonuclease